MSQTKECNCADNHIDKEVSDCTCKCHSPKVSPLLNANKTDSKGQEGKAEKGGILPEIARNIASKRNVSTSKVTKVAEATSRENTTSQEPSPSSFENELYEKCILKSIVERDYHKNSECITPAECEILIIDAKDEVKQKVKDFFNWFDTDFLPELSDIVSKEDYELYLKKKKELGLDK